LPADDEIEEWRDQTKVIRRWVMELAVDPDELHDELSYWAAQTAAQVDD
jgi:hypothetical protein